MGLGIMEHRAQMAGGNLRCEARAEGGTRILCEVPLAKEEA